MSSRTPKLSLGPDRTKLVAKFNRAHPKPGMLTQAVDRVVESVEAFEARWTRKEIDEEVSGGVETRSNRGTVIAFAFTTLCYPYVGRLDRAPVFFGAMALAAFISRAWTLWHRAHPPVADADSRAAGIIPAIAHATGALAIVLLLGFAMKISMPYPGDFSDFNQLFTASCAAAFVYQRRTGWKHKDPEIGIVAVTIALVFSGLWTVGALILGKL